MFAHDEQALAVVAGGEQNPAVLQRVMFGVLVIY